MFHYLLITNKPDIASFAELCGVTRIFVDLEKNGKFERQGHLDTLISEHCISDIAKVKSVLNSAELMVRLNPLYHGSKKEIDDVIANGADIIMMPMFHSVDEVREFGELINGRVKLIPLIETKDSAESAKEICELDCVDEVHIGLNDLHLDLGLDFMFELLSNDYVDKIVSKLNKPYGIGGIARFGEGLIPGEMVMAEQVRLNSTAVILSRTFHRRSESLSELKANVNLSLEIKKLENFRMKVLPNKNMNELHSEFSNIVSKVVLSKK